MNKKYILKTKAKRLSTNLLIFEKELKFVIKNYLESLGFKNINVIVYIDGYEIDVPDQELQANILRSLGRMIARIQGLRELVHRYNYLFRNGRKGLSNQLFQCVSTS